MTVFSSAIIVTHELFYGASQALRDYLNQRKVRQVLFISHPLRIENRRSYYQIFRQGRLTGEVAKSRHQEWVFWQYLKDTFLTFFWVWHTKGKFGVYVGVDPLNCVLGILLRRLRKVEKIIFYAIDFVPRRFNNPVLNQLYHQLETWCVKYSDERWNVSVRIAEGRRKFLGLNEKKYSQKVLPIGVWQKEIISRPTPPGKQHWLVFTGHLLRKQGLQEVIKALPLIKNKIPDVHLLIIGGGEYEAALKELVDRLDLEKTVTFLGWISDQKRIRGLLSSCALGLATYKPEGETESNFTYYADPTKIKTYLSCGLPVVMTAVPFNAGDLVRRGCAEIVDYDEKAIANTLIDVLTDREKLEKMRKNAIKTAREFTWEKIFEHIII